MFIVLSSLTTFKSILSQSRCSLEPKNFLRGLHPLNPLLRGSEHPPEPPALLTLATIAFPLIMFTAGIISVFYLTLFPAGFPNIHPGHNKMA